MEQDTDLRLMAYQQAKALVDRVDRMRADDPAYRETVGSDRYQLALETVAKMHLDSRRGPGTDPDAPPKPEREPREKKEPRQCLCGCGGMTKGGRFLPGHDARYHAAQKKAGGDVHVA